MTNTLLTLEIIKAIADYKVIQHINHNREVLGPLLELLPPRPDPR